MIVIIRRHETPMSMMNIDDDQAPWSTRRREAPMIVMMIRRRETPMNMMIIDDDQAPWSTRRREAPMIVMMIRISAIYIYIIISVITEIRS